MLNASPEFKRNWLDKRLAMEITHSSIIALQEAVWRFCCQFAYSPSLGNKIVLYGNSGSGKSHCVKGVRRWVRDRAIDLPLVNDQNQARLVDCIFVNWAEQVDAFKSVDWGIDDFVNASLLIIDDIGAEHDPSKCGAEKLYLILEKRERKWTIITTNYSPNEWESKFERRIADRLMRRSTLVDLSKTPSYSVNT